MRVPTVVSVKWPYVVPLAIAWLAASLAANALLGRRDIFLSVILGLGAVSAYRLAMRFTAARHHARGMRLVKRQDFAGALEAFRQSTEFWGRHRRLDSLRCITMLSPGLYSNLEMGWTNAGFCLSQLGRHEEAREAYRKALELNPDNGMAVTALRALGDPAVPPAAAGRGPERREGP